LLLLAPDIQEELLFLAAIEWGRDAICLRDLLPIAGQADWNEQRLQWHKIKAHLSA
jgi:hypothetical protein